MPVILLNGTKEPRVKNSDSCTVLDIDTTKPVDRTGNIYCGPLVAAAILSTSTGAVAAHQ